MSAERPIGGSRGVVEAATSWRSEGRDFALVVVTVAEGSTYRKPGAIAAWCSDGRHAGAISGGCLEPQVEALARRAMQTGDACEAILDTRRDDDLVFGSGSGCRGRMTIVALPGAPALDAITAAWTRNESAALARVGIRVPPHVLLVGAGPAAAPLVRLALGLGWRVSVVDHREARLGAVVLADRVVHARPAAGIASLRGARIDAAIVATHQADADLEALRELASLDAPVGLMGPPARRDELLVRLTPAEREALAPKLRAPVGLRLPGDGPESIALGIAAELQGLLHS